MYPNLTKPQSGRLNKSPHTVHAFAIRSKNRSLAKPSDHQDEG
jgi:hypothetical protein